MSRPRIKKGTLYNCPLCLTEHHSDDNAEPCRLVAEHTETFTTAQELIALFAVQRTRMKKATRLWRKATGNHDVLPDLGDLLEWLMNERAGLRNACQVLVKAWASDPAKVPLKELADWISEAGRLADIALKGEHHAG